MSHAQIEVTGKCGPFFSPERAGLENIYCAGAPVLPLVFELSPQAKKTSTRLTQAEKYRAARKTPVAPKNIKISKRDYAKSITS